VCQECGQVINHVNSGHKKKCKQRFIKPDLLFLNNVSPDEEPEKLNELDIPDEYAVSRPFYPYQQKVYDWAKDKDRVGFFLEMRLGKTMITIRWMKRKIKADPSIKKILILCPKTVLPVWQRELAKEGITPILINPKASRQLFELITLADGWFLTNYECLTATELEEIKWDAVILDEGNKIKDPNTKITRKLTGTYPSKDEKDTWTDDEKLNYRNYIPDARIKADLTGTPAPETLLDYYNQIKFLGINLFDAPSWWQFKDRFFRSVGPNKYAPWPYLKEALAGEIANYSYVLKRDQVGMGSHKVYEKRYCEITDSDYRDQYDALESSWSNDQMETEWMIVVMSFLQQMAGGFPKPKPGQQRQLRSDHKLRELMDICFEGELKDESIIIWCRFVEEIKEIQEAIKKYEPCYSIYGDVVDQKRQDVIDAFMQKKFRLLPAQIRTASMGIDLSVADTAIYYSNEYGATSRLQSEDRVIHPEKKSPVLFIDLLTENTIDQDVLEALEHKTSGQTAFLQQVIAKMKERHGQTA